MKNILLKIIEFFKSLFTGPNGDISSKRIAALGCFGAAFLIIIAGLAIKQSVEPGTVQSAATFCASGTTILTAQSITKT